jgi:hypothetical protein
MSEQNPPESTPEPHPEPAPEPSVQPAPEATPPTTSSARPLLYGCLSVVLALPFGIVYILLTAAFGLGGGAAAAAAVVLGMFLLRRDNKKPIVGAFAVGAAIAFALYGTCLLIIAKSS